MEQERLLVTLDRDGMLLDEPGSEPVLFPARIRLVYDVTGAGDMVQAVMGACVASGWTWGDAAELAVTAAGLQVERPGVAPVTWAEIVAAHWQRSGTVGKIVCRDAIRSRVDEARRRGQTVVFTNGCFDLLHAGHVRLLQQAAELGDGEYAAGILRFAQEPDLEHGRAPGSSLALRVQTRPTGGLLQRIDDVDTSIVSGAPTGWTTPADGGLNLVTDYQVDDLGRETEELDPPITQDVDGTATTLRPASWTVYDDANQTVRVGRGYATGTGPDYTYLLTNPVEIQITDLDSKPTDDILATRASTSRPAAADRHVRPRSYVRWQTYQYTDCCLLESQRLYRLIPASGTGSPGANFDQTGLGYDVMKRRVQLTTPGGTISFTVFDVRDLPQTLSIGTDNSLSPTNNMVVVAAYVFDNGASGGDGNLTQLTQVVRQQHLLARRISFTTGSNRLMETDGEIDFCETRAYDNLDRLIVVRRYDTTTSGNLIGLLDTAYDDLSRVYRTTNYAVDPGTGTVGNTNGMFPVEGSALDVVRHAGPVVCAEGGCGQAILVEQVAVGIVGPAVTDRDGLGDLFRRHNHLAADNRCFGPDEFLVSARNGKPLQGLATFRNQTAPRVIELDMSFVFRRSSANDTADQKRQLELHRRRKALPSQAAADFLLVLGVDVAGFADIDCHSHSRLRG